MAERNRRILQLTAVLLALMAACIYWLCARADAAGDAALLTQTYVLQGGDYAMDLNTADAETLACLPGIGEELAARIVEYRDSCGGFVRVEQLLNVHGIGEKTLERVRPFLTVSRSSP